jgi:hypothetical protein
VSVRIWLPTLMITPLFTIQEDELEIPSTSQPIARSAIES